MTKEDFLAGLPFKMHNTKDLQPVYSFVSFPKHKSIQIFTIYNPDSPQYHCMVIDVNETLITIAITVLNKRITFNVLLSDMHRVGDALGQSEKQLNNG